MTEIKYLKGDATNPKTEGNKIIAHICNDIGGWGKGFVMAISKKWKNPEEEYQEWFKNGDNFNLGEIQMVQVEQDLWIANMIAQHKINPNSDGIPPIRYDAIEACLKKLSEDAQKLNATIHMPRIGCGLAGGKWEQIEPIIINNLSEKEIEVYVYDLA